MATIFGCKRADTPAATGVLIIHSASEIPDPSRDAVPQSADELAKEQQGYVATLMQRSFLSEALQDAEAHKAILNTSWNKEFAGQANGFESQLDDLAAKFKAEAVPGSQLIRLSISGTSGQDGVAILTAIGDFYIQRRGLQERKKDEDRIKQLTEELQTLEAQRPTDQNPPSAEEQKKRDRIAAIEMERDRIKNLRMAVNWKQPEWFELPHAVTK
jgi:hypothetical protein